MPTNIAWTDETWNVAVGCTKVSEGCKNCYMIRDMSRKPQWANVNGTVTRTTSVFNKPLKLREPSRIFTSSLTDLLHESIDEYRYETFEIMRRCPHHQFQVLTKRIERLMDAIRLAIPQARKGGLFSLVMWLEEWIEGSPPANVWIGVSIACNNEMHRIDTLGQVPAFIRFVSFEPLIERISNAYRPFVDWIIIGGESGPASGKYKARACHLLWINELIHQYKFVEYPASVFVKQFGSDLARNYKLKHPKGEDPAEWPENMQLQEFPAPRFTLPDADPNPRKAKQANLFA